MASPIARALTAALVAFAAISAAACTAGDGRAEEAAQPPPAPASDPAAPQTTSRPGPADPNVMAPDASDPTAAGTGSNGGADDGAAGTGTTRPTTPHTVEQPGTPEPIRFGAPEPVTIEGWSDHAMEPFITRNAAFLLFNNSNARGSATDLHIAERIDDHTFAYRGPLAAANSGSLDAVASVGPDGFLYFVSVRSYEQTFSTLYRVPLQGAAPADAELVPGMRNNRPGIVNFDAEISPDGSELHFVVGAFSGANIPDTADLAVAIPDGDGYTPSPRSHELFAAVNTELLEYAPATSADGRLLFFTRLDLWTLSPEIWYSQRATRAEPWGEPQRVEAATGFVEAATITGDGSAIYYHEKVAGRHVIRRIALN